MIEFIKKHGKNGYRIIALDPRDAFGPARYLKSDGEIVDCSQYTAEAKYSMTLREADMAIEIYRAQGWNDHE